MDTASTGGRRRGVGLYFSDHFEVSPEVLKEYGAFNISVVSDLPLFIDPFLLFNSSKPEYTALHEAIVLYLQFLKSKAAATLDPALIDSWYRFKEVKQNWLGFTLFGNEGHALGREFAMALHESLGTILDNFGSETVTRGTHLEKLLLLRDGVGRDSVSDFTTNLIKHYLLDFTQTFAKEHLQEKFCSTFQVPRAAFNYNTESWVTRSYYLPRLRNDFVLLTPSDLLTRDDTWINHGDMIKEFSTLPDSIPNAQLRAQINNYFKSLLSKKSTEKERAAAAKKVIREFPDLIDLYIKRKEDAGDEATPVSRAKVTDVQAALVEQVRKAVPDIEEKSDFYDRPWTSFDECLERVLLFKDYVENQDGYKLINSAGKPFSRESDVQLFFGLIWCRTEFDVNREPNNGRGPVDFKVSFGSGDKSLIEFKLASNTSLKRNLQKQVEIYEKANKTNTSVKVIICYTRRDETRVKTILKDLGLSNNKAIVVIDARSDNKPSASKA